jgi:DNA-binding response OmpR family regulator
VVLDLGLPRLNGRDVKRELNSRPDTQHIPVVVVSGNDTSDLDPHDFACVLRKPINSDDLLVAVQNCLRRRGERLWE